MAQVKKEITTARPSGSGFLYYKNWVQNDSSLLSLKPEDFQDGHTDYVNLGYVPADNPFTLAEPETEDGTNTIVLHGGEAITIGDVSISGETATVRIAQAIGEEQNKFIYGDDNVTKNQDLVTIERGSNLKPVTLVVYEEYDNGSKGLIIVEKAMITRSGDQPRVSNDILIQDILVTFKEPSILPQRSRWIISTNEQQAASIDYINPSQGDVNSSTPLEILVHGANFHTNDTFVMRAVDDLDQGLVSCVLKAVSTDSTSATIEVNKTGANVENGKAFHLIDINSLGKESNAVLFTQQDPAPPPTLDNLTPSSSTDVVGPWSIDATGTGFQENAVFIISAGDTNGIFSIVTVPVTGSSTQIGCTLSASSNVTELTVLDLRVKNPDNQESNSLSFNITV